MVTNLILVFIIPNVTHVHVDNKKSFVFRGSVIKQE